MTEIGAFRDYQSRSTVLAERERTLESRRLAVQELRQTVATLQSENTTREERLSAEREKFHNRKTLQDEKVGAKDAHARAQQDRLAQLTEEEEQLNGALRQCEQQIGVAIAELERRQELEGTLREAKNAMTKLKFQLEEKDAKVMKLETRLARQEMTTDKRHANAAEALPQYWLPRLIETDRTRSLEDTAGESILLVDDLV